MNFKMALKLISSKSKGLTSFIAMDVLEASQELRRQGKDVISLSVGEPDFPAPAVVKRATIEAIRKDVTKYTHSQGMPELREAICRHYFKRYKVKIHPDQILVTSGTSPAMLLTFGALLNPGDEVIMSDPHYPCYSNFIKFLDGKIVMVKVREEDAFQYRPEEVRKRISKKTKAIFVNSPANPTGCSLSAQVMRQLAGLGKLIVSDEIYHGLTYEGEEHSILEFTDRAFVFNGFSKAFSMTGFRLGYVIAPRPFIPVLQKMQQNFYISTSSFIQMGGIAALTQAGKEQEKMRQIFNQRRKAMVEGLRNLGFGIAVEPTGAFYVFANAKRYTHDSYRFAFDVLRKNKVGMTPGIDFGPSGEGYLRFSYATDVRRIREGLSRLGDYLRKKRMI
jgi:(5-formylfuran-3-yl)methyl phosphate transaminase